ncbi:MAG: metallophosphoesterase [Dehalococcoidia bacterium]|nr:metallophosphoesterase [Dehalococcoidia bacterium]
MKVVLFSDLHLDSAFAWMSSAPGAARRRRQALRDTLLKIIEVTVKVKADALLCGGDLYEHDRFTPDTAAFLKSTFERLHPIPVFIAPGNHDWYGPQSLYCRVEWSPNVHIFYDSRLQPFKLEDGLTLWGAAHLAPASTPGFLDGFKVDRGGVHLALFHGSERGGFSEQGEGKAPHAPFDAEQVEAAGIHHAFLGHYHRPRDYERLTYPGNPDPLSFGEDGLRGAVVATVAGDGSIQRERVRVAVTEVHDITVDVTGCGSQQDVRSRVHEAIGPLRGVARVTLSGELVPEIDLRSRDMLSLATSLESLTVEIGDLYVAYDLETIKDEATVRGEFVRQVTAADLPEDEKRRVLVTGLRALDGREDLEVT